MSSTKKLCCRLCSSKNLKTAINLGTSPLANNLTSTRRKIKTYPLVIKRCNNCFHYQLSHVVSHKILFDNYFYKTGISKQFNQHFKEYAKDLKERLLNKKNLKALDIGANDGTLINFLIKKGFNCAGIEPAKNLVKELKLPKKNIIINDYLNKKSVKILKNKFESFDLICANNVFAHVDNLKKCFELIKTILKKNGIIVFEVSYFKKVVDDLLFDTIYHEHLDYHTISPLRKFLKSIHLNIVDLKVVKSHGGSLRLYVMKSHHLECKNKLSKEIFKEKDLNSVNSKDIKIFNQKLNKVKIDFRNFILRNKKSNKKIVGYSAPAKLTTFIHYTKINQDDISVIFDDNELKNNKYVPNTNIKILKNYKNYNPDIVIIFAWNLVKELKTKVKKRFKKSEIYITLPYLKKV